MSLGHGAGIVRSGLVLHLDAANRKSYPGSGTSWFDLNGNNNGTLVNSVGYNNSNLGSMVFDGIDDVVTLGNISSLGFTDGVFSVSVWLKIPSSWTSGSQYPNLISKGASAGWDTDGWSLYIFRNIGVGTGYVVGLGMRNGATAFTGDSSRINDLPVNTPLNIVATASGSGNSVRLYKNGSLISTQAQTINPASNNTTVTIGRGPSVHWYPGDIYNIQVYNRALTAAEISQNFNALRGRYGI